MAAPSETPKLTPALLSFPELGGCQEREISEEPAIEVIREYEKCVDPSLWRAWNVLLMACPIRTLIPARPLGT